VAPPVTEQPTLVFGLPLYGRGEHLDEALESLLRQTRRDFAIVVTDDAGDPEARAVLDSYTDGRVRYFANERRLGLVGNWRRSFEVARREFPAAQFFAWASDHDAWHPFWVERVIGLLEAEPKAVMAFPSSFRMDAAGVTVRTKNWRFDTAGAGDAAARLRGAVAGMSAGNMVYGAYRVDALERAGVFRYALLPDRLLLTELSLQGDLRQVPQHLFFRRVTGTPSIERQRASFWPDGAPRWSRLPWAWQHVAILGVVLARGGGPPGIGAGERAWLLANHVGATFLQGLIAWAGRVYYEHIMRRRSLKWIAVKRLGRTVEWLQQRRWGVALLGAARRTLDLARG
jgi:glycosyltransferase involved in cell wall biosynthesis